jgi:tRNA-specific 2-thiouridylase
MFKKQAHKKVFVGMSGGVDSSVSAAILKKQGYDVTGCFIKTWHPDFLPCTWKDDRLDAMRVCAHLDIPFLDIDLEKEYKEEVFDYMIREYKSGKTPNPDVMCNKKIKFGGFYNKALELGADFIATGHYARVHKEASETNQLLKGTDGNKDQTYFLWTLTKEQLDHIIFPIGDMLKPDVRKLAEKLGLPTAQKKESQGLCFVGKIDMKDFLKRFLPEKKGNVLNEQGEIIGWHEGAHYYTIGQRHGFTITKKTPKDSPYLILSKNVDNNTLTVSQNPPRQNSVSKNKIALENINWTIGKIPDLNKEYQGIIRYRQEMQDCQIIKEDEKIKVVFKESQNAISSGQSLVLYDQDICLGGGIIL